MQIPKNPKHLNCLKFLCTLTLCLFGFSQDAQEIIAKIESNQAKIIDLEAEVEIETSIQGKSEPLIQTMKIWQAKDEKRNPITRTEFFVGQEDLETRRGETMGPGDKEKRKEKVIMVITGDSIITKRGEVKTQMPILNQVQDKSQMNDQFQMTNGKFFDNLKEAKILRRNGTIAVLEIIPNETEGIKVFDKAEITVDTEKGVITSQKLFTPMGVIKTEMEYERQGDREMGRQGDREKKIWVLKEMKTITQYGVTTMRYKNVKVNKGIKKEKFRL